MKKKNKILEDHGDWLIVDISTERLQNASMAVDSDFWDEYSGGVVWADVTRGSKYIRARYNKNGVKGFFHRLVIPITLDEQIDHIKHGTMNFIDNRRSNLRVVDSFGNALNKGVYKNNKSGCVGVYFEKRSGKWISVIKRNNKRKYLGSFRDINMAIDARERAEAEECLPR